MKKSFWLFLMALTVFKKDSHAGFESHSLKSKKSEEGKTNEQIAEEATTQELLSFLKGYEQAEEKAPTQEILSFLKSSDPNPEQITGASQLFQNLLPPAKRRVFFECFDAFTDLSKPINPYIKKERLNKKTFAIFFKENYLKLDKELSKSLFTDLLSEKNYPVFTFKETPIEEPPISNQEIIALFNRIQNLCSDKNEQQDFMKKALIRILPFTVDKTMQDFFCQQYTFCSKGAKHAILLETPRWEHMWNFSKTEFLQQSQQPKDKLELLKAMSSYYLSSPALIPQERSNKKSEHTSFIMDHFDSFIKEHEKPRDPSSKEDVAQSQLKNLKGDIIDNLLALTKDGCPEILQRLHKIVKSEFETLSLSQKIFAIARLVESPTDTDAFELLISIKEADQEIFQDYFTSKNLERIAEKVSIENPQVIQWFAERFEHFRSDDLQVLIAEFMITPENVRSFTQKAALNIPRWGCQLGWNNDTIFDFAARELEKQHFILETSEAENTPLKARNTKLNIFLEDLLKIIGRNDNDGYDKIYRDTIKNHEKLKDSIVCMKELLGDETSLSILRSYDFKKFREQDLRKLYNIAKEIGSKKNLNFIDNSWWYYATVQKGPEINPGAMIAIHNCVQNATSPENPTGEINLEDKQWRLSYRVKTDNGDRVENVEFKENEKEEVRKANQQNLPSKEDLIEKLNKVLEGFDKYKHSDFDIIPKKLRTQSEEKKA